MRISEGKTQRWSAAWMGTALSFLQHDSAGARPLCWMSHVPGCYSNSALQSCHAAVRAVERCNRNTEEPEWGITQHSRAWNTREQPTPSAECAPNRSLQNIPPEPKDSSYTLRLQHFFPTKHQTTVNVNRIEVYSIDTYRILVLLLPLSFPIQHFYICSV